VRKTTPSQDFIRGIWDENPVLIQMLGLCPALAVTNSVKNALAMSAATFFVICCSSVLVSTFKRFIPNEVRIPWLTCFYRRMHPCSIKNWAPLLP
jgi:Na+-translocating ferredoxin:NAD+ oxidoreductase RnfE subunit